MGHKNKYGNKQKQDAHMNARDCLLYGYGKSYWNSCGIDEQEREEIWSATIEHVEF